MRKTSKENKPADGSLSASKAKRMSAPKVVTPVDPVRVLCVDDHAVLVEGLKAQFAIDKRIQCDGYLPTAQGLLEEVTRLMPNVVLLDIEMPGPDVFEMADRLRHKHPDVRFIFLSAHVRDGYLTAAYKCGAWGYFSKADDLDAIVNGIMDVARSEGGAFIMGPKVKERFQPAAGRAAAITNRARAPQTALQSLTVREIEVLRLIGKGFARNDIAEELSRSAKTIDGHQERIMKKLDVTSRAELVRFAIREGLAEA